MKVQVSNARLEHELTSLSAATGRAPDELVEDALDGYFVELARLRADLDSRYDELKNGSVTPMDGGEALALLKARVDRHRHRV